MESVYFMYSITTVLSLLWAQSITFSKTQASGDRLQVTDHFVTLKQSNPRMVTVMKEVDGGCIMMTAQTAQTSRSFSYFQCNGQLNGTYTWTQENPEVNNVLFFLNERAEIDVISLTYIVPGTQSPKVTFCAQPDGTQITHNLSKDNCRKIEIEQTGGMISMAALNMPFNNVTISKVSMEVITQSIKSDFVATGVQFLGRNEVTENTTPPSVHLTTNNVTLIEDNTQAENTTTSTNGVKQGSPITTATATSVVLAMIVIISSVFYDLHV